MTQQIVFKPLGLVTQPSPVALEPGAMFTAIGMYIRSPGLIENAFGWKDASAAPTASGNVQIITPLGNQYLLIFPDTATPTSSSTWSYQWNLQTTGVIQNFQISMVDEDNFRVNIDETARFSRITIRDRTLVNGRYGILMWDKTSPTSLAERTARRAGMMPPIIRAANQGNAGSAIPAGNYCHVTAILRRKYADGYEIVSAPAPSMVCSSAGTGDQTVTVSVALQAPYTRAGDYLEVYRTRSQVEALPGRVNTGADFYLSKSVQLSAADIALSFISIFDTCPDTNLGEALYTNSGVQGADAASLPPPTCKCSAVFKGYAFYGNRIDPPTFPFRIPAYWGTIGNTTTGVSAALRKAGIGARFFTGTTTNGSPTVTAISAADIVGIVVGQILDTTSNGIVGGSLITAVTASTVTFNANANTGGSTVFSAVDVLYINGTLNIVTSANFFVGNSSSIFAPVYFSLLDRVFTPGVSAASAQTVPADKSVISMLFEHGANGQTLTIRGTNGQNYVPEIPIPSAPDLVITHKPVPNGISWSELNQPENCPSLNTAPCGSGEIYAMASTRDALWIFASDGLWRLSGTGGVAGSGYDWRIDPVDSTLIISGPQAFAVLRDTVFAYTNRGLVSIDSSGNVAEVSNGRIGDFLPGPMWTTPIWSPTSCIWMAADETNDEILLKESGIPAYFYRYNILTDTLVQDTSSSGATNTSHGVYSRTLELPITALSTGLTRTVNTAVRVGFTIVYRFVFAKSFFTQKHWRVVDLSISSTGGSSVIEVFCNNVTCGVRTLPSRTGYTVARNCPAVSNTLELKLVSDPLAATPGVRTRLQAVAVKYDEFTEQRKVR